MTDEFIVFDLETQRSAKEVGGWKNIFEMKVSVGVIWYSKDKKFKHFYENQIDDLKVAISCAPLIIGFNHLDFDYRVLSGYSQGTHARHAALQVLNSLHNLDLMVDIKNRIGRRIGLENIAQMTLNHGKSADGQLAIKWYKDYLKGDQEALNQIAQYCQKDVEVTRDVYLFGKQNGYILYSDKYHNKQKVQVDWGGQHKSVLLNEQLSF